MVFDDYEKTGVVYHIVSLMDLKKVLTNGIDYDDKITYQTKYDGFHQMIDQYKPSNIPKWLNRSKCIFASMNYPKDHKFHSHSAILSIKIDPKQCWIANENHANAIYEPLILKDIEGFEMCQNYLRTKGREYIETYWNTSLSFEENLIHRKDGLEGYDAEVLIATSIPKTSIRVEYIVSDHKMLTPKEWIKQFIG